MNGVLMPSTSAGSSQRGGTVTWTPQVSVPSGAAAAGPKLESSAANTTITVDMSSRIDSSGPRWPLQGNRQPRVHRQHLSGDIGRRVGGQKDDRAHELVGPTEALEWDPARQLGAARLGEERGVTFGHEEPRRDRVGGDALVAELDRQRPHQRL